VRAPPYHAFVEVVAKTCGRVVLLNDQDQVLLLLYQDLLTGRLVWSTPGGAVQNSESRIQAAERELREETGIVTPLGPEVWRRTAKFRWNGQVYRASESFFLARVARAVITTAQMEMHEAAQFVEDRWWNPCETTGSRRAFAPRDIGQLTLDLVAGNIPAEPIRIGL
jgi:8-oxo-dGTP pyrophosphatase MutT (NUDIX family)